MSGIISEILRNEERANRQTKDEEELGSHSGDVLNYPTSGNCQDLPCRSGPFEKNEILSLPVYIWIDSLLYNPSTISMQQF